MAAIVVDYGRFVLHPRVVDVSARIRELAAAAREVGATRVRHGDIEIDLGPAPIVAAPPVEAKKITGAELRARILNPSGRVVRLPV